MKIAGNLKDEDKVLVWLTADSTRELPDQIEDVNEKMLEKLLHKSDHIAVLFCEYVKEFGART